MFTLNLFFFIPTIPPYLYRSITGIERLGYNNVGDGSQVCVVSYYVHKNLSLEKWRQKNTNEILIPKDLKLIMVSVNNILQFSVIPPKLKKLFGFVRSYFRWFLIDPTKILKGVMINDNFSGWLCHFSWIDLIQKQVKEMKK